MKKIVHKPMNFALNHVISVRSMPIKGIEYLLTANEEERAQLAKNHGLIHVNDFTARYHLHPWKKKGIKLKGFFSANIIQTCIVSLLPVENWIKEEVSVIFMPEGSKLLKEKSMHDTGEFFFDPEGPDLPETYYKDIIEIGAITEELFELAIDPYPRCAEAEFTYKEEGILEENVSSPFGVLKDLNK